MESRIADFTDKDVLVISGSRGIGAAILRRFAAGGGKVTFTYLGSEKAAMAVAKETGVQAVQVDSADRQALVRAVADRGPLDIIVISAGILVMGDSLTLDSEAVDRMFDVNIRGSYHAAVGAARGMRPGGRIIVIGATDRMPFAGSAAYALTKSAVQGMVGGLARDFGDRNITVNAIQPGPTDSDLNPVNGPMAEMVHSFMAIKCHAYASEVAELVAFIAGPHAAMITGSRQTIDGGFSA